MPKVTVPCAQCGDPVDKYASDLARLKRRVFCSRTCYYAARRQTTVRPCAYCLVPFRPRHRQSTRFCSERCARLGAHVTTHRDGYKVYTAAHPTHPGQTVHSVVWRSANPDGVCEDCGAAVEVIHHRDEDKTNNELSNLAGLCRSCHLKRHHMYCRSCNRKRDHV